MPYSSFYGWRGLTSVLKGDRLGQYVFFLVMMRHRTASWYTVVASPHKIYSMRVFSMNHHVHLFFSNSRSHRCSKMPCFLFLGFSSVPCCFFKGQTVLSHGCRCYHRWWPPGEVSPCGKRNPRRKRKDRWRTSWRRRRCRRLAEVQGFFFATSQLQKLDLKIFKIFNQSRNIVTL